MKKTSKALLLGLCALLLVGASVLGTMAYLTSTTKEVVNSFTVGNVNITLDEKDTDNSTPNADRDIANAYHLLPGSTYEKDPTVHVTAGSSKCYVFVKVENGISAIEQPTGTNAAGRSVKTIADQMTAKGWKAVTGEGAPANVFVYVGTENGATNPAIVDAADAKVDLEVFSEFTVGDAQTNDTLDAKKNEKINVTAYAIQADGWANNNALDIWNAASFN